jgi:DNA-binding transcriptional regulator YdaS (Cro superfamily)
MIPVPGVAKLKSYMKARALTQSAFAEKAGVPGPQVSLWLSGARCPSIASALKIETATGGKVVVSDWAKLTPAARKRIADERPTRRPRRAVRSVSQFPDEL